MPGFKAEIGGWITRYVEAGGRKGQLLAADGLQGIFYWQGIEYRFQLVIAVVAAA